ncbi:MAG: AMP-binding protein [Pseudomonadales bacterium]|nr:AMP-binding protein [Pseudomonadales bacterium]
MSAEPILSLSRINTMVEQGYWSDKTVLDYFDQAVAENPQQIAIVDSNSEYQQSNTLTYEQLAQNVNQIALGLIRLGIKKHDVVSFQLPNWWQFSAMHFACLKIGAISNPLMPIFRQRELSFMLGFAESKLVVVPSTFRGFDHLAMIQELRPELPACQHVLAIGASGEHSFEGVLLDHNLALEWDAAAIFAERKFDANEVVQVIYTSGTTGMPKGVMHTSNTLICAVNPYLERLGLDHDDTFFMGSPLAHQTGFLYGVIAPVVLQTQVALLDVWSATAAWSIIDEEKASFTMASTPFLSDLVGSNLIDECCSDRFRLFVCGGAPVPRALVKTAVEKLGVRVISVWGMTEQGAVTSTCLDDDDEKIFNTDGKALAGMEVRVVDENQQPMAVGQEGILQARGAFMFVGYLKKPEAYAVDAEGWFDTGDLAKMDADGYIRISGRSKDIIIRGGENIPVVEIENLLFKHAAVEDVAIVAMPDERLGELGCCFITLMPGFELDFASLQIYLIENQVAKQYWPERLEIIKEMPRTASGKIQKFQLKEIASEFKRT